MIYAGRSALITRVSAVMGGTEAREIHSIGPNPTAPGRHCAAIFRFAAMFVFLVLSACAKAPATEPRASLPAQRNLASPAPTPCNIPNIGQAETPNVLNSPQPSDTDRLKVECLRGVPPLRTTWSGPTREPSHGNVLGRPEANSNWESERFRQEKEDFQRRQRNGR